MPWLFRLRKKKHIKIKNSEWEGNNCDKTTTTTMPKLKS